MITSRTTDNSSAYKALFKAATEFLNTNKNLLDDSDRIDSISALVEGGGITSIQQYFAHIRDLYDLDGKIDSNSKKLNGRKFLMLPLDEPCFIINADKREITVPNEFKKNGISVQGDEIAESLIFRINRFYDYIDLNETKAQVQWENGQGDQGVSDVFTVVIGSDTYFTDSNTAQNAEYLYIMWPLSEAVTRAAGTIKFSLRFYKEEGDVIKYSLSTKIASAVINKGHNYEISTWSGVDSAVNSFNNAITNSKNLAAEDAPVPFYLIDLTDTPAGSTVENTEFVNEDCPAGTRLEAYIDTNSPTQTLRVEAASEIGNISYKWQYVDTEDTRYANGLTYNLVGEEAYIECNDEEAVPHKEYYRKENDVYTATGFAAGEQMYEKTNVYVVQKDNTGISSVDNTEVNPLPHVVGLYKAIATNRVGDNTETADSITICFPRPEKLDFTENGNLKKNSYLTTSGEGELQVEVEIDEHGATDTYEWEYGTSKTGPFTPVQGDNSELDLVDQNKINANGSTCIISGLPGFYRVKANSTRNYETISKYSDVTKVTYPLAAPTIVAPVEDVAVSSLVSDAELRITLDYVTDPLLSEGMTYQWYNDEGQALEGINASGLVTSDTITYTVPQGDRMGYYCIITNHMGWDENHEGGEAVSTRSVDFSVNKIKPGNEPTND